MNGTRRDALRSLFGAGLMGLRALSTGLPLSLLRVAPGEARGAGAPACAGDGAQFLILSTSSLGDPVNANAPGTYAFPDIVHPADPALAKAELVLGARRYEAAQPWTTLPEWARARACFFHHATLTNNHPNLPKVLRLMGATARQEMLPSLLARELAPCLGTVQTEPVVIGQESALSYEGRPLPALAPTGLREVLARPGGPLGDLQRLRDRSLDRLYALAKQRGDAGRLRHVDRLAQSRDQARALSEQLLSDLSAIKDDGPAGQVIAAAVLVKMRVAPVVAISIGFGGDNHYDPALATEARETQAGVRGIADLLGRLRGYGVADQTSFALLNVFGRTLKKLGSAGRDHWGSHHTSLLIGAPFAPGVIGGLQPGGGDYYASDLDSRSGAAAPGGDVPFAESLSALGKTLGAGLGVPRAVLDASIDKGKVVAAALARA